MPSCHLPGAGENASERMTGGRRARQARLFMGALQLEQVVTDVGFHGGRQVSQGPFFGASLDLDPDLGWIGLPVKLSEALVGLLQAGGQLGCWHTAAGGNRGGVDLAEANSTRSTLWISFPSR